jgi:hypothetical protein
MDPAERTLRARLGAHTQWANETDRTARTAPGRKAAAAKFVKKAEELHPGASPEVIAAAAEQLRKAHFTRMALASAKKRKRGAGTNPKAA